MVHTKLLTHWGLSKMADILQTFSNAFSGMKIVLIKILPKAPIDNKSALTNSLASNRHQVITWTNDNVPHHGYGITRPQWVNRKTERCDQFRLQWIDGLNYTRDIWLADKINKKCLTNSLWPCDAIWPFKSTLAQLMACFLMAQAINWINVDFSLMRFCGIHMRAISQRMTGLLLCIMYLKIIL